MKKFWICLSLLCSPQKASLCESQSLYAPSLSVCGVMSLDLWTTFWVKSILFLWSGHNRAYSTLYHEKHCKIPYNNKSFWDFKKMGIIYLRRGPYGSGESSGQGSEAQGQRMKEWVTEGGRRSRHRSETVNSPFPSQQPNRDLGFTHSLCLEESVPFWTLQHIGPSSTGILMRGSSIPMNNLHKIL